MNVSITSEQRDAFQAQAGAPLRLIDEQNQQAFYLIDEASLLHMRAISNDRASESETRLRALIQEGIDSPGIPAGQAAARLRQFAQKLVQGK
jgi:hypothetical protein